MFQQQHVHRAGQVIIDAQVRQLVGMLFECAQTFAGLDQDGPGTYGLRSQKISQRVTDDRYAFQAVAGALGDLQIETRFWFAAIAIVVWAVWTE